MILPGSITIGPVQSLAPPAWPVLFFVGPRRQTTLGIGPDEP